MYFQGVVPQFHNCKDDGLNHPHCIGTVHLHYSANICVLQIQEDTIAPEDIKNIPSNQLYGIIRDFVQLIYFRYEQSS